MSLIFQLCNAREPRLILIILLISIAAFRRGDHPPATTRATIWLNRQFGLSLIVEQLVRSITLMSTIKSKSRIKTVGGPRP